MTWMQYTTTIYNSLQVTKLLQVHQLCDLMWDLMWGALVLVDYHMIGCSEITHQSSAAFC